MTSIFLFVFVIAAVGLVLVGVGLQMRQSSDRLAESERRLGPVKFAAVMLASTVFFGLFAWLTVRLDYPQAYNHQCHGGCLFDDLYRSPELLRAHRWDETALFALLWAIPVIMLAAIVSALVRKVRGTSFSIYSDEVE